MTVRKTTTVPLMTIGEMIKDMREINVEIKRLVKAEEDVEGSTPPPTPWEA